MCLRSGSPIRRGGKEVWLGNGWERTDDNVAVRALQHLVHALRSHGRSHHTRHRLCRLDVCFLGFQAFDSALLFLLLQRPRTSAWVHVGVCGTLLMQCIYQKGGGNVVDTGYTSFNVNWRREHLDDDKGPAILIKGEGQPACFWD